MDDSSASVLAARTAARLSPLCRLPSFSFGAVPPQVRMTSFYPATYGVDVSFLGIHCTFWYTSTSLLALVVQVLDVEIDAKLSRDLNSYQNGIS